MQDIHEILQVDEMKGGDVPEEALNTCRTQSSPLMARPVEQAVIGAIGSPSTVSRNP
jgi:hypothetical protein